MKKALGVYFMIGGILVAFHMIFNVYLPSQLPRPAMALPPPVPPVAAKFTLPEISRASSAATEVIELAKYEHPQRAERKRSLFEIPNGLKKEVAFWTNIYTKYTNDEAVLHDPYDLGNIYGVIKLPHCNEPPRKECLEKREDAIQQAKDEFGIENIRAQTGQKDKFEEGIRTSEAYLPKIEEVFKEMAIPIEISRLPFVESMFNVKAYSKSRAAGIWQLMPQTARLFGLKVGGKNDERYDPVKATRVAAKHLLRDYNRLGSWELAINAYNSGPGRLADAVRQLGTRDIVKIIKHYYNPSYGFAARNFYPCFLAALNIYENRFGYFPELAPADIKKGPN